MRELDHRCSWFAAAVIVWSALASALSAEGECLAASPALPTEVEIESSAAKLYTRTFRVDPDDFLPHNFPHLLDATPAGVIAAELQINAGLTNFNDAGESKRLFYNDRTGLLMVRGTLEELGRVEAALQRINVTPPKVGIEVRIAEYNFEELPGESPNPVREILRPFNEVESMTGTRMTVLTANENRLVQRALEQVAGVEVMTRAMQVTVSGRQVRLQTEAYEPAVTIPPFTAPGKEPKATWSR